MEVLQQPVLVLNSYWQPIDEVSAEVALCNLCKGAMRGIDTSTMTAYAWEQWIQLPVRENDWRIMSSRGPVRVPRVVVAAYAGMPEKKPKLNRRGVGERDNYTCSYSGDYCPDGTLDHVVPRSQGGAKSWENLAWSRKDINHVKANRTPEQAGLKLRRKPTAPKPVKACLQIKAKFPEWEPFVYRKR